MTTRFLSVIGTIVCLVLVAPRPSAGQVDCSDPDDLCTGDPCVIGSVTVASPCVVDFGPRAVVIAGPLRAPGAGMLSLSGGTITVRGRIATSQAAGAAVDGADVSLSASGDLFVNGTIRTSGGNVDDSGDISLTAGGDIELTRPLRS